MMLALMSSSSMSFVRRVTEGSERRSSGDPERSGNAHHSPAPRQGKEVKDSPRRRALQKLELLGRRPFQTSMPSRRRRNSALPVARRLSICSFVTMRPHHPHRRHSKIATFDGAVVEIEPSDGRSLLLNIARAILARILFIVHSLATIWQAVGVHDDNSVWSFALISVAILVEGGYAVIMRAGDERKWFSASVLLYILATAPPIWMLETEMCKWRSAKDGQEGRNESEDSMEEIRLQLLEQLLLVVLILNRWLLPKGRSVSREQLSQILLAYLAISSDIVEFFDVFKEHTVFANVFLQRIILYVWTLSLLQFPFVLTVSRARKMRLALTNEEVVLDRSKGLWQDIPFLCVRLYLIIHHRLFTYTMGFFTCKNALIIFLQTYRAFVLINDRYLNPRLLEEPCRRPHSRTHRRPRHRRCLKKEESESQPMVTRT